jgi:hypothetical protein
VKTDKPQESQPRQQSEGGKRAAHRPKAKRASGKHGADAREGEISRATARAHGWQARVFAGVWRFRLKAMECGWITLQIEAARVAMTVPSSAAVKF